MKIIRRDFYSKRDYFRFHKTLFYLFCLILWLVVAYKILINTQFNGFEISVFDSFEDSIATNIINSFRYPFELTPLQYIVTYFIKSFQIGFLIPEVIYRAASIFPTLVLILLFIKLALRTATLFWTPFYLMISPLILLCISQLHSYSSFALCSGLFIFLTFTEFELDEKEWTLVFIGTLFGNFIGLALIILALVVRIIHMSFISRLYLKEPSPDMVLSILVMMLCFFHAYTLFMFVRFNQPEADLAVLFQTFFSLRFFSFFTLVTLVAFLALGTTFFIQWIPYSTLRFLCSLAIACFLTMLKWQHSIISGEVKTLFHPLNYSQLFEKIDNEQIRKVFFIDSEETSGFIYYLNKHIAKKADWVTKEKIQGADFKRYCWNSYHHYKSQGTSNLCVFLLEKTPHPITQDSDLTSLNGDLYVSNSNTFTSEKVSPYRYKYSVSKMTIKSQ